jgi:hypothetical protein
MKALITLALISYVTSQNNGGACLPCNIVTSLLSQCSLPPLSTPENSIPSAIFRNVTGLAPIYGDEFGPTTFMLATYEDASCFCTKGVKLLFNCNGCTEFPSTPEASNAFSVSVDYELDCQAFGYYADDTQAYPSTTLTASPTASVPADQASVIKGCSGCDVVAAQIAQCGLTALNVDPSPVLRYIDFGNGVESSRYILFNRTAGECFCTLPVLDKLDACFQCMGSVDGDGPISSIAQDYLQDCGDLGYFPDRNLVVYQTSSSASQAGIPTKAPTTTIPTPTGNASAGGAKNDGVGLIPTATSGTGWWTIILGIHLVVA